MSAILIDWEISNRYRRTSTISSVTFKIWRRLREVGFYLIPLAVSLQYLKTFQGCAIGWSVRTLRGCSPPLLRDNEIRALQITASNSVPSITSRPLWPMASLLRKIPQTPHRCEKNYPTTRCSKIMKLLPLSGLKHQYHYKLDTLFTV